MMRFTQPQGGVASSGGGSTSDPDFASVVGLWHFDTDGTDSSTKGHNLTLVNSAVIVADPVFGAGSLNTPSAGSAAEVAGHADFALGSGDFTVEGFVKTVDTAGGLVDFFTSGQPTSWQVFVETGKLAWYAGSTRLALGATSIATGSWVWYVAQRKAGVLTLWVDGRPDAAVADTTNYAFVSSKLSIGRQFTGSPSAGTDLSAKHDEVRLTKGVARYFITAPTAAFPNA